MCYEFRYESDTIDITRFAMVQRSTFNVHAIIEIIESSRIKQLRRVYNITGPDKSTKSAASESLPVMRFEVRFRPVENPVAFEVIARQESKNPSGA